jgi:hypothetical protein
MTRLVAVLGWIVVALATLAASSCDSGGIGMQVPHSGARWSGPGPDVIVGGGPR